MWFSCTLPFAIIEWHFYLVYIYTFYWYCLHICVKCIMSCWCILIPCNVHHWHLLAIKLKKILMCSCLIIHRLIIKSANCSVLYSCALLWIPYSLATTPRLRNNPAGIKRWNNVESTLFQLILVEITLIQRCFNVWCLLGYSIDFIK